MVEADLNRMIVTNLNRVGWGYKIPDPQQAVTTASSKRPFDGFGILPQYPIYFESKLIKGGYKAFNFNHLREHQIEALTSIRAVSSGAQVQPLVGVLLGIWESRTVYDLFFFEIDLINYLISQGKKSLLKKELLMLRDLGLSIPVKKQMFEVDDLGNKRVTRESAGWDNPK